MKPLATLAVAAASQMPALSAQAMPTSLLVNGSFETLAVALNRGAWTVVPSLAGWVVDGTSGVEVRHNVAGTAQDGFVFIELDTHNGIFNGTSFDRSTNSWISQTVATILGQHYTLSWFYAPRAGVAADTAPIEVLWNGSQVAKSVGSGMGANAGVWQQYTIDVIGTGTDTLMFAATGKQDSFGGSLDNVSLVAVPGSNNPPAPESPPVPAPRAIPEPAGLALVLAALGGLALFRRRPI